MESTTQPKVTHWKKLTNPNYIGAHDLQPGQELTVVIENIRNEVVKNFEGGKLKEETCIVAYFKGAKKPMILNKTNCKIITRIYDTPYIEDWLGKKITLYAAKISVAGEPMDALRVKHIKQ